MAVINDYRCAVCKKITEHWSDQISNCHGRQMEWLPSGCVNFEWRGPRTYLHLRDEPFRDRSSLFRFAKDNGLSLGESSEKVGGARNEMYDGIGKTYSYLGASGRSNPLADLPRRQ